MIKKLLDDLKTFISSSREEAPLLKGLGVSNVIIESIDEDLEKLKRNDPTFLDGPEGSIDYYSPYAKNQMNNKQVLLKKHTDNLLVLQATLLCIHRKNAQINSFKSKGNNVTALNTDLNKLMREKNIEELSKNKDIQRAVKWIKKVERYRNELKKLDGKSKADEPSQSKRKSQLEKKIRKFDNETYTIDLIPLIQKKINSLQLVLNKQMKLNERIEKEKGMLDVKRALRILDEGRSDKTQLSAIKLSSDAEVDNKIKGMLEDLRTLMTSGITGYKQLAISGGDMDVFLHQTTAFYWENLYLYRKSLLAIDEYVKNNAQSLIDKGSLVAECLNHAAQSIDEDEDEDERPGLLRMSRNPMEKSIDWAFLLGNESKSAYVLFGKEVYYIDTDYRCTKLAVKNSDQLESIFPEHDDSCGLMNMSVDPQNETSQSLKLLVQSKPAYVLFNSSLYYVDKNFNVQEVRRNLPKKLKNMLFGGLTDKKVENASINKLKKIHELTNHMHEINLCIASRDNQTQIRLLTSHDPAGIKLEKALDRVKRADKLTEKRRAVYVENGSLPDIRFFKTEVVKLIDKLISVKSAPESELENDPLFYIPYNSDRYNIDHPAHTDFAGALGNCYGETQMFLKRVNQKEPTFNNICPQTDLINFQLEQSKKIGNLVETIGKFKTTEDGVIQLSTPGNDKGELTESPCESQLDAIKGILTQPVLSKRHGDICTIKLSGAKAEDGTEFAHVLGFIHMKNPDPYKYVVYDYGLGAIGISSDEQLGSYFKFVLSYYHAFPRCEVIKVDEVSDACINFFNGEKGIKPLKKAGQGDKCERHFWNKARLLLLAKYSHGLKTEITRALENIPKLKEDVKEEVYGALFSNEAIKPIDLLSTSVSCALQENTEPLKRMLNHPAFLKNISDQITSDMTDSLSKTIVTWVSNGDVSAKAAANVFPHNKDIVLAAFNKEPETIQYADITVVIDLISSKKIPFYIACAQCPDLQDKTRILSLIQNNEIAPEIVVNVFYRDREIAVAAIDASAEAHTKQKNALTACNLLIEEINKLSGDQDKLLSEEEPLFSLPKKPKPGQMEVFFNQNVEILKQKISKLTEMLNEKQETMKQEAKLAGYAASVDHVEKPNGPQEMGIEKSVLSDDETDVETDVETDGESDVEPEAAFHADDVVPVDLDVRPNVGSGAAGVDHEPHDETDDETEVESDVESEAAVVDHEPHETEVKSVEPEKIDDRFAARPLPAATNLASEQPGYIKPQDDSINAISKQKFADILETYKSQSFISYLSSFWIFSWISPTRSQTMRELEKLLLSTQDDESVSRDQIEKAINKGDNNTYRVGLFKEELRRIKTTGTDEVIVQLKEALRKTP